MSQEECMTFADLLAMIPDPRKKRGVRHAWKTLLVMISVGLLRGEQTLAGIGDTLHNRADFWEEALDVPRLPSHATLRRAMRDIDVVALEGQLRRWGALLVEQLAHPVQALALDGKAVRGAQKKGQKVHLLSVVTHTSGVVLGQAEVGEKTNEIPIARHLLTQVVLKNRVVTADAMHTHHATIEVILRQEGHYLLVAKDNQPELVQSLRDWFAESAWNEDEEDQDTTTEHGHGRDERRTLTARCLPQGMTGWPSVRQALRRVTWRCSHRTGKIEEEVTYAITDVPRSQAGAARLEQYWRGHWGIENRVHYVRDVLWGEDANQCAHGATAQALAALRNGLLSLLRLVPVRSSIAASLRFFASDPFAALSYLFSVPS